MNDGYECNIKGSRVDQENYFLAPLKMDLNGPIVTSPDNFSSFWSAFKEKGGYVFKSQTFLKLDNSTLYLASHRKHSYCSHFL